MGLRFIRKPSDTPNVQNVDDIRMIRYAYGGADGYIKGKGTELSLTPTGGAVRINSGIVSLHGCETEIDANGVSITIETISTLRYYTVYYEVNLATQTTAIKATYSTSGYPTITTGDDLTSTSTGTARLPLYRFTVQNGVISGVGKLVNPIEYSKDIIAGVKTTITGVEQRLDNLGFRSEAVSLAYGTASVNYIYRQGNYIIGCVEYTSNISVSTQRVIGTLPNLFRPKKAEVCGAIYDIDIEFSYTDAFDTNYNNLCDDDIWCEMTVPDITISTDGNITAQAPSLFGSGKASIPFNDMSSRAVLIKKLIFGFEAPPIEE